ncbi:MAG: hypothetical protein E6Q97_19245 [Desulfurellales bacterium]|nr:MAG: hypothetical protein E6Q97_19245 [Desulfurellales bacterium]
MPDPESKENENELLDMQIAEKCFGWKWFVVRRPSTTFRVLCEPYLVGERCEEWDGAEELTVSSSHYAPLYSTDPAAADRVMEWLQKELGGFDIEYMKDCDEGHGPWSVGSSYTGENYWTHLAEGSTWMEAICHAALALVRARGTQESKHGKD